MPCRPKILRPFVFHFHAPVFNLQFSAPSSFNFCTYPQCPKFQPHGALYSMRPSPNATVALQCTVDSFIPSARTRVPPFHWSCQHAHRSQKRFHRRVANTEHRLKTGFAESPSRRSVPPNIFSSTTILVRANTNVSSPQGESVQCLPIRQNVQELEDLGSRAESVQCLPTRESVQESEDLGPPARSREPSHLAQNLRWLDGDAQAIRDAWSMEKASTWNDRILIDIFSWLFRNRPDRAILVANNTLRQSDMRPESIWNIMHDLVESQLGQHAKYADVVSADIVDLFLNKLNDSNPPRIWHSTVRRILFFMLTRSNLSVALRLYDALLTRKLLMHWATMLQFAHVFAKNGDCERALQCITEAVQQGAWIASEAFKSTCNIVLHQSLLQSNGYHYSIDMLSRMADLGYERDIYAYTILMKNAFEAGDLVTALRIFDHLEQSKIPANHYVHAVLLQGLREYSDPSVVETAIAKAMAYNLDDWAATELILCVYFLLDRNNTENVYNIISQMYLSYFDPSPLKELGILPGGLQTSIKKADFKPLPTTLGIMLTIFLKLHGTEQNVVHIYNKFRAGVARGTSLVELTTADYTYNTFLHTASQWPGTLRFCADILRDMSSPLPSQTEMRDPKTGNVVSHTQPTVQTWSILVHAFARHRQPAAAEKVVDLMQQRNITPDVVTWTSLIKAHAQVQDTKGVASAIKRQKAAGVANSDRSWTALRNLKDRAALARYMNYKSQQEAKSAAVRLEEDKKAAAMDAGKEEEDWFEDYEIDERYLEQESQVEEELPAFEHEMYGPQLHRA